MGEKIIYHNFGGNNEPEKEEKESVVSTKAETIARGFSTTIEKVTAIKQFLSTVGVSNDTLAVVSAEVANMDMKDVFEIVAQSTEQDWRLKPMYFKALTDRINPSSLTDVFAAMISGFKNEE
mgnify:CR=1 FL=1